MSSTIFKNKLEQYAKIAIEVGINLKEGQKLQINSPIECVELTRLLSKIAFEKGAKDVIINWVDEVSNLIRFENAPFDTFKEYPQYLVDKSNTLIDEGCAFLSISSNDPELLKDIDPIRVSTWTKTRSQATEYSRNKLMNNDTQWLVLSAPTKAIARKIFPDAKTDEEAINLHWESIFKAVRIDDNDAVENWNKHISVLKERMNFLNENKFKKIILVNSDKSTDLSIELPEKHYWVGGGDYTPENHYFVANMPTEEIFTMPLKTGVNGVVKSTKPLIYNGNTIDNFTLTFDNGKVIDYTAEVGYETLKSLITSDEGSCYLGELALVPDNSPISNSGITFYNTLFDENASCHLALGRAYPTNLVGGNKMSKEELELNGANSSFVHEDFMIGSNDLNIWGVNYNDEKIQIFKDGNFVDFK